LANGRFHWIIIIDVVPRKQSELEDVKGLVISDYQRLLEEKWVKELKAKYSVEVNNSKLRDVYTELEIN
jgi:peptidyl-prolyl cis-trans isomerase SurA